MVNEHWLQHSYQLHYPLTRESACPFEVLKPGIDILLAMKILKILKGIFLLILGCFIYTENLLFSIDTFLNDLPDLLDNLLSFCISTCISTLLCTFMLWKEFLCLNFMNQPMLASNFSSATSSSLSLHGLGES